MSTNSHSHGPSSSNHYILKSSRTVLADGVGPAWVEVEDGTIITASRSTPPSQVPPSSKSSNNSAIEIRDLGDLILMPGLIDCHVHINEPGRTEWEGFDTATYAAAAGGVTTLVDMPLNCSPVTTTAAHLKTKLDALGGKLHVDCAFWGGVIPQNASSAETLQGMVDAGVLGFKCFMVHSGIDEFPNATEADLRRAMPIIAQSGLPLLAHAELDLSGGGAKLPIPNKRSFRDFVASRPGIWELDAIELLIRLSRETGCRVHIVHLSYAGALPAIRAARAEGLPITVETCFHYLCLNMEDIPDGDTRFKCAPPIRERANNEHLWEALADGTIDFVVTDHSPATPALKKLEEGNLESAWGGISSLQYGLPLLWTEARKRGFDIPQISRLLSTNVAKFLGLSGTELRLPHKGSIVSGAQADFVVWDPDGAVSPSPSDIRYKHKISPYMGRPLTGKVHETILRGSTVFADGMIVGELRGNAILRK